MKTFDPKAAAEAIRKDWESEAGPLSPDDRRALTFLEKVCEHLGVEASPANAAHVGHLLSKHGIQQHDPAEYPKALNEKDERGKLVPAKYPHGHPCAGADIVFVDEDDEQAWEEWKAEQAKANERTEHFDSVNPPLSEVAQRAQTAGVIGATGE